jgi:hypothetical protein
MSRLRAVALAALALATSVVAGAPPAQALPAVSATVVVVAGSGWNETPFKTVAGEPYLVTATGAFSYDVLTPTALADCGWRTDDGMSWERSPFLLVNGAAPGCASQPYSPAHTYQWTVMGTGAPFRFEIADTWIHDDAGALTFVVTGARADVPHEVTSFCYAHRVSSPALDYVPIVIEAGAQATESEPAASTFVDCTVTSASGEVGTARLGAPGPLVEAVGRVTVPAGDQLTVCWHGGATWDDAVEKTTPRTCYPVGA